MTRPHARIVILSTACLLLLGTAAVAAAPATNVTCTITANVLNCPLPVAAPVTTTVTVPPVTVTVTAAPTTGVPTTPAPPASAGFVTVCGTRLCVDGQPWTIHGATTYGQLDNQANLVALAGQAKVNTLELVEYEKTFRDLGSTMAEDTWARVDQLIGKAKTAGLHVLLNFSSYGQAVLATGAKPTTKDWNPFLTFVMNRTNTVTGVKYKDDPTIAKIELYAEIDAPNYAVSGRGTTKETTDFFARTLGQLRALDTKHVISTGGFSYINDPGSGFDWRTIMSNPQNQVCDTEINSIPDRNISVPLVANYCAGLNKPWFLGAFSSCQGTSNFADDINHWPTDALMAAHIDDMYRIARHNAPAAPAPTTAAVGADFWNLGNTPARVDNCDIGTQYPVSLAKVQQWAP